jgi:hypothetical protein
MAISCQSVDSRGLFSMLSKPVLEWQVGRLLTGRLIATITFLLGLYTQGNLTIEKSHKINKVLDMYLKSTWFFQVHCNQVQVQVQVLWILNTQVQVQVQVRQMVYLSTSTSTSTCTWPQPCNFDTLTFLTHCFQRNNNLWVHSLRGRFSQSFF